MMTLFEQMCGLALFAFFVCAIMMVEDNQPWEKNARERGELQASLYVPQPTIIDGE